jgi:hypothetical protein
MVSSFLRRDADNVREQNSTLEVMRLSAASL